MFIRLRAMSDLRLAVKRQWFEDIRSGIKTEEYRLATTYWAKRLVCRQYDYVIITLGYPAANDFGRIMTFDWNGCTVRKITHPHFGLHEVKVFAIDLSHRIMS